MQALRGVLAWRTVGTSLILLPGFKHGMRQGMATHLGTYDLSCMGCLEYAIQGLCLSVYSELCEGARNAILRWAVLGHIFKRERGSCSVAVFKALAVVVRMSGGVCVCLLVPSDVCGLECGECPPPPPPQHSATHTTSTYTAYRPDRQYTTCKCLIIFLPSHVDSSVDRDTVSVSPRLSTFSVSASGVPPRLTSRPKHVQLGKPYVPCV